MAHVTGSDVAAFLGRGNEPTLVALAQIHAGIVTELAKAYTRGRGFDPDDGPNSEIRSVIIMATARVVVNPEQSKREQFGDYAVSPGTLYGWTLVELQVLNRYRKRNSGGVVSIDRPGPDNVDGGDLDRGDP